MIIFLNSPPKTRKAKRYVKADALDSLNSLLRICHIFKGIYSKKWALILFCSQHHNIRINFCYDSIHKGPIFLFYRRKSFSNSS